MPNDAEFLHQAIANQIVNGRTDMLSNLIARQMQEMNNRMLGNIMNNITTTGNTVTFQRINNANV